MNKNIKLYCISLFVFYVVVIGFNIFSGFESFTAGLKDGYNSTQPHIEGKQHVSSELYNVKIKPKEGFFSFPDTTLNTLTNDHVNCEVSQINIKLSKDKTSPHKTFLSFALGTSILSAVIYLAIIVYIPFLFFQIVRIVSTRTLLDYNLIRKLTRFGWMMIILFLTDLLITTTNFAAAYYSIELEKYYLVFDFPDTFFLIIGIVLLLFSEILKESLRMKEEHDLTI